MQKIMFLPMLLLFSIWSYGNSGMADVVSGEENKRPFALTTTADCSLYSLSVTANDGYVCDEGTTILTASAPVDGDDIYWYDAAVGGNFVGNGTSYETPYITQNTSFWAAEVILDGVIHTGQGNVSTNTTLGSTTNGGITFTLTETVSILNFEARSTSATGGAVTYALIDVDNGNSVLMVHNDTLPAGGSNASPELYTVHLNFMNIPPGNYRLIRQSGAASAYISGSFPHPLGTAGTITTGAASATSTSTLNYHIFNLTIDQSVVLCSSTREEATAIVVDVEGVDVSATATTVNIGGNTSLTASSTNTNYTYAWTWDSSTGGGTGSDTGANITVTPSAHTTFTVTATDSITGCTVVEEIEILVFDTTLCLPLDITATNGAYICDEGTAILTATANGTGDDIYWYDAAVGGNKVGEGTAFETPFLTQTTSYWAAEALIESSPLAGQAFANPTTFSNSTGNNGVLFEVTNSLKIIDVEVFKTNSTDGDITIELRDVNDGNSTVATATVNIAGGGTAAAPIPHTITLNFDVPPGSYRLVRASASPTGVGMGYVSAANSSFPYPLGQSGMVTGGATLTGSSTTQYYFFNWTIEEPLLLCESDREEAVATVVDVEGVNVSATTTSVNPGGTTSLTATSANTNYVYTWEPATSIQGSNVGTTVTTTALAAHTTFTVTATDSVTGCIVEEKIDILVFDTTLCNLLDITVTNGAYICDEGTAILTATANANGVDNEIYWYDAAVGGNKVGTGISFETPFLTQTTSYWAAEVLEEGGLLANQGYVYPSVISSGSNNNQGVLFTLTEEINLVDVEVFSTGAGGSITIELRDVNDGNATIATATATVPSGGSTASPIPLTVPLNFTIPPGEYRLLKTSASGPPMAYTLAGNTSFPYPIGTSGEITSGSTATGTATTYYYFFNWTISSAFSLCESAREEAVATVVDVEGVDVSATAMQVNPGGSTSLTASSTNTNYIYTWEPAAMISGSNTGATVTTTALTAHTTFTVTATDSVTGCIVEEEIEILVFDTTLCLPLEITAVTGANICDEGTAILTATVAGTGDEVYWYDAATGGNLVGKGTTFETPYLTQTTSYWAAEALEEGDILPGQGVVTPSGTSTVGTTRQGLVFEVFEAMTIVDVEVYSTGGGGDVAIELYDNSDLVAGNELASVQATLAPGTATNATFHKITLNFDVQPGTYRIVRAATSPTVPLRYISGVANFGGYPIPLGTAGQITTGANNFTGAGLSTAYYHFFNWTISTAFALCESDREEAIATVNEAGDVSISASATSVNIGGNSTLTASSTNTNLTYTWTWDSSTGGGIGTDTGAVITVSPTAHTVYTVTATDSISGCMAENDIQILVFDTTLCNSLDIITTTGDTVCIGETADLSATASGTGDIIRWYDSQFNGNLMGIGSNFETPVLTNTTSYWAAEVLFENYIAPIETSYTAGGLTYFDAVNGAGVTFAVQNTNTQEVTMRKLDFYMPANTSYTFELWYHSTNITGSPGIISSANGWIQIAGPEFVTSGPENGIYNAFGNLSFGIPASTTYRFILVGTGAGSQFTYIDTNGSPNMFSSGGVNLLVGNNSAGGSGNVGYSGQNPYGTSISTNPRFFHGGIDFNLELCESDREEAIATVTSDAAPVGPANQNFVLGETLANLDVTGTNLTWYEDAAGTLVILDNTPLVDAETYYVSQTINGCESQLLAITVTEVQPCDAPTNVVLVNVGTATGEFSWTASPHETNGYNWAVMEDGDDPLTDTPVDSGTTATGITTATATGLDDDTDYDFYVQTDCGATNVSTWTGPLNFTTDEIGAPICNAPSAIVISNITDSGAAISWTENGTATQWEIEYGTTGFVQGTGTVVNDNDGTLGETLSGLLSNTGYDVYIRAICSTTNASAWIGPETFTTLVASCPDPSAIVISNITDSGAAVSWTENGTATQWEIEYGTTGFVQGTGTVVVDNDGTLGETLSGLPSSTGYDVYVRAICSTTNASAWIGPVSFTTLVTPCADPSAIVISNIAENSAEVSWTENGTATQWEIEYGATGFTQGTGTVVNDNDGTLGETLSGLSSSTGYDVYVRAICSTTNESAWIGPETFTTLAASCPAPSAIAISNITENSAEVSWTENGTATEWEIEYGPAGYTQGSGGTVVVDNDGTLGETLSGLADDTAYDVYVRAICSTTDTSGWAGPETFTTDETVGVNDHDFSGFTYYPNPMADVINISSQNEKYELIIFNVIGQKMITHKMEANTATLDVSHLASGSYFMQVVSDSGKTMFLKLIKE